MGFFTAENDGDTAAQRAEDDATITQFWAWWAETGLAATAEVFDADEPSDEALQEIGDKVGGFAEDLGLGFESGPGRAARHVLVFTPAGDPELADVADRWLAAAPAADEAFEYDNRRRAVEDPESVGIAFGEQEFDLIDMTMTTERDGDRLDIHLWHPAFVEAPQEVAGNVAFLLLDALLGEGVVEAKIGEVRFDTELGADAVPMISLRELLA